MNKLPKCVFLHMTTYVDFQDKYSLKQVCNKYDNWIKFTPKEFNDKYFNDIKKLQKRIDKCVCDECEICNNCFSSNYDTRSRCSNGHKHFNDLFCVNCLNICSMYNCDDWICNNCANKCICGEIYCDDCSPHCNSCEKVICETCEKTCYGCDFHFCSCTTMVHLNENVYCPKCAIYH